MRNPPQVAFCEYSGAAQPTWLWLEDFVEVIETRQPAEVLDKLEAVERAVAGGLYAAGFVSYEAAPAMDAAFRTHPAGNLPLLWFGLFRRMTEQAEEKGDRSNLPRSGPLGAWHKLDLSPFSSCPLFPPEGPAPLLAGPGGSAAPKDASGADDLAARQQNVTHPR
jgi:hypothetical protein